MRSDRLFLVATAIGIVASLIMAHFTTPLVGLVVYGTYTFEFLVIMVVLYVRGYLR